MLATGMTAQMVFDFTEVEVSVFRTKAKQLEYMKDLGTLFRNGPFQMTLNTTDCTALSSHVYRIPVTAITGCAETRFDFQVFINYVKDVIFGLRQTPFFVYGEEVDYDLDYNLLKIKNGILSLQNFFRKHTLCPNGLRIKWIHIQMWTEGQQEMIITDAPHQGELFIRRGVPVPYLRGNGLRNRVEYIAGISYSEQLHLFDKIDLGDITMMVNDSESINEAMEKEYTKQEVISSIADPASLIKYMDPKYHEYNKRLLHMVGLEEIIKKEIRKQIILLRQRELREVRCGYYNIMNETERKVHRYLFQEDSFTAMLDITKEDTLKFKQWFDDQFNTIRERPDRETLTGVIDLLVSIQEDMENELIVMKTRESNKCMELESVLYYQEYPLDFGLNYIQSLLSQAGSIAYTIHHMEIMDIEKDVNNIYSRWSTYDTPLDIYASNINAQKQSYYAVIEHEINKTYGFDDSPFGEYDPDYDFEDREIDED